MSSTMTKIERRLRLSGMMLIAGLLVEGVCLLWARPLAFIVLVALGGLLVAAGIVIYLQSLVSAREEDHARLCTSDRCP
jgi:hypothetical protein